MMIIVIIMESNFSFAFKIFLTSKLYFQFINIFSVTVTNLIDNSSLLIHSDSLTFPYINFRVEYKERYIGNRIIRIIFFCREREREEIEFKPRINFKRKSRFFKIINLENF